MIDTNSRRIGDRIGYYRERLDIRSTTALADRISNPKITAVVIQNIEAGRKTDISVSQLFDIADGLGISPLLLLVDIAHPFEPDATATDAGQAVLGMTPVDLLAWARIDPVWGRPESPVVARINETTRDILTVAANLDSILRLGAMASRLQVGTPERDRFESLMVDLRTSQSDAEARLEAEGVSLRGLFEMTKRLGGNNG